jgi:hypothetical protein
MPELKFPRSTLGPIVHVTISPSTRSTTPTSQISSASSYSQSVPMLVDTGAERTLIDEALIDVWGLVYVSASWVTTINGTKPVRSFEISLSLGASAPASQLCLDPLIVMARRSPFQGMPFRGLLGRDVLSRCVFVYNGPNHECSLSY